MPTIDFIYDFGSPNAYLAHRVLPALCERTGATVNYIPCLLGGIFKATGNQSPFMAFAGIRNKLDYDNLEMRRFVEKHNLSEFRMNQFFPVNTLMLMRGAVAAQKLGQFVAYNNAMFHFMWEEPRKLDDSAVFAATIAEAGLDVALLDAIGSPEVKQTLLANTEAVVERGAFGIPTFYVGREMWFGKDRLGEVEEYIAGLS